MSQNGKGGGETAGQEPVGTEDDATQAPAPGSNAASHAQVLLRDADPMHRNWLWWILQVVLRNIFVVWLRYRSRGQEDLPPTGALFLINHQSMLDPLLVGAPLERPVSYLARDSLFRVPIIGWILKQTYVIPIRREAAGTESIRKSVERLKQGYYVGIFPEGTRSRDGRLGLVKPGFIALARRASVPIVPVGIAGALQALPRGGLWVRPVPVCVVFGEPITPERIEELSQHGREREFVALIQERMQACLSAAEEWRSEKSAQSTTHEQS